jgi:ABC-type bacteriocin/lantibiotic exporter with double-glycine peptidase domain
MQAGLMLLLMIASTLTEVLSVGAVLPFLGVLIEPERVFSHRLAKPLVDFFGATAPKDIILPVTLFFCVAIILATTIRQTMMLAQMRFGAALATDFSVAAYRSTLFQPYSVHVARNSSDVIAGVSKAGDLGGTLITPCLVTISSIFLIAMILTLLTWASPLLAFSLFLGFGIIYAVISLYTRRRLAAEGLLISAESSRMIKALQEGLGGIRDVLIDGSQAVYAALYQNSIFQVQRSSANILIIGQSPRFIVEGAGTVLIAGVAYLLAQRDGGLHAAIPILGGLAMGAQRILPAMQQAYSSITVIRGRVATTADALDLLEQPLPAHALLPPARPIPFEKTIVLERLRFRYSSTTPWVLDGVNFAIRKGEMVGLIGITGSGKSTLIDIVMGLLEPTEGSLVVDGQQITIDNQRGWQTHIAHVPQSIFLADTTIAENIAFGMAGAGTDLNRVKSAAKRAQISTAIESWKDQYATVVGERGVRLSGGQRQRIGIARALYRNANVLIFDEATSALDNATESMVMESIEALGDQATIIIIAHRLTTLRNCQRIIELSKGKVSRIGNYEEIVLSADRETSSAASAI